MRDRALRAEVGFSLIEVLFALAILGISLLAIVPMLVLPVHSMAAASDRTGAAMLMREKMELLADDAMLLPTPA